MHRRNELLIRGPCMPAIYSSVAVHRILGSVYLPLQAHKDVLLASLLCTLAFTA